MVQAQANTAKPVAKPYRKKCIICGELFEPRWRDRQVTCGKPDCQRKRENQTTREHQEASKPPIKPQRCAREGCSVTFTPKVRNSRKYCSLKCAYTARRLAEKLARPKVTCALPGCDVQFIRAARENLKYCSREHMRIGVKREQAEKRHKAAAHKWAPRRCEYSKCGKVFVPKGEPWNTYCSPICRTRAAHERAEIPTALRLAKKHGLTLIEGGKETAGAVNKRAKKRGRREGEIAETTRARITLAAYLRMQGLKDYDIAEQLYPLHATKTQAWNASKNSIFKHAAKLTDEQGRLSALSENVLRLEIEQAKSLIAPQSPKRVAK